MSLHGREHRTGLLVLKIRKGSDPYIIKYRRADESQQQAAPLTVHSTENNEVLDTRAFFHHTHPPHQTRAREGPTRSSGSFSSMYLHEAILPARFTHRT